MEHWYERTIGVLKQATKYRIHSQPEMVMASAYLMGQATAQLPLLAGTQLLTISEHLQLQREQRQALVAQAAGGTGGARPSLDSGGGPGGSKLEGIGRPLEVGSELWVDVQGRAATAITFNAEGQQQRAAWRAEARGGWANCKLWQHDSATSWSKQQLTSSGYGRSRTRDGRHVLTYY
jgi:hypothetical protein